MAAQGGDLDVGQIRRQVRLGSECVYRVCRLQGDDATVEVVRAPGLTAGQRFTFTRAAVEVMQLVSPGPDSEVRSGRSRAAARPHE